jgi:SAM-dependent methyltransferase
VSRPGRSDRYNVGLGRYYDWLARFQLAAGRLAGASSYDTLTVHRLLSPPNPGIAPADVAHERLLAALQPLIAPHVVDAGCGFGGTIFYFHERAGGVYDGLTLSDRQRARAAREARRRGVSTMCRFHVQSYDRDLADLVPNGADLVLAIESLAHSPDPARTIANLAGVLRTGGALAIVDDVPVVDLPEDDPDFAAFRAGWCCPAIARQPSLVASLHAAGLTVERDEDWSSSVMLRDPVRLERLVRANQLGRRLLGLTPARVLMDALHGGLMLERLYRRGLIQYRLLIARRT